MRRFTGELFTRAALDFETSTDYALYVTATDRRPQTGNDVTAFRRTKTGNDVVLEDGGGASLSSQALMLVRVRDVNDNAPRIDVHALSSSKMPSSGSAAGLRDVEKNARISPGLDLSELNGTGSAAVAFRSRQTRRDGNVMWFDDCATSKARRRRRPTTIGGVWTCPRASRKERSSLTSPSRTPTPERTAASGAPWSARTASP